MAVVGIQFPEEIAGRASAVLLAPERVLEALRDQLGRVDASQRAAWRECRVIEALYHPARYVRVAYVLSDRPLARSRFWSEGQIVYLHGPVRPPPSRRGQVIRVDDELFEAYAFPNDRRLRGLRKFAGMRFAQQVFQQGLARAAAGEDDAPTKVRRCFIRYVPEQKLVVRLRPASAEEDDAAPGMAVRLALPAQARRLAMRQAAAHDLHAQNGGYLRIPRLLSADVDRGVVAMDWVGGRSLLEKLREGDSAHVLKRLARMLHEFHALPIPELEALTASDAVRRVDAAADILTSACPDLAARLTAIRREFAARIHETGAVKLATLHNDFHWDQVRIRRRNYALLDLERLCLGDPLVDIANFVVEVRLLADREGMGVSHEEARRWTQEFLLQWVGATGCAIDGGRFHTYGVMAALKLAAAMLRHLRPGWPALAQRCVETAESHLAADRAREGACS